MSLQATIFVIETKVHVVKDVAIADHNIENNIQLKDVIPVFGMTFLFYAFLIYLTALRRKQVEVKDKL